MPQSVASSNNFVRVASSSSFKFLSVARDMYAHNRKNTFNTTTVLHCDMVNIKVCDINDIANLINIYHDMVNSGQST